MLRLFRWRGWFLETAFLAITLLPLVMSAGCSKSPDTTKTDASKAADKKDEQAEKPAKPAGDKLDTGRGVLEEMAAAYRQARTYQDKAKVTLTARSGEKNLNEEHEFAVAFERPNKILLDIYGVRVRCDGRKYRAFIEDMPGQVVEKDSPEKLNINNLYADPVLLRSISMGGPAGAPPQPLLLLDDNALKILLSGAAEPELSEPGEIDGFACYRVRVPRPEGSATFWVDKQSFVLRRIELSTQALRGFLEQKLGGAVENSRLVADFFGAKFDKPVAAEAFQFEMPQGDDAHVKEYFVPPHPGQLIGKKAPAFKFTDDAGRNITPESLAGKIAVILFWSPIQGEFNRSLADLQKIYDGYKNEEKVVVCAVCLDGESFDEKAMEDLRRSLKLELPIYRDTAKNTPDFKFFDVVFILGPDGTVQDYQLVADIDPAAGADLPAVLQKQIESLLAEKPTADEAAERYRKELQGYEKALEGMASGAAQMPVQANIAPRSEPTTFNLRPLWKCEELKNPGNILVVNEPKKSPRLLVACAPNQVAELGLDGKVLAIHQLNMTGGELITNLRSFTTAAGKTYVAAFAGGQQRLHLFNLEDKHGMTYPPEALENPHNGLADVELFDLDGDGTPEIYVGFSGVVGVHAVALDGRRIWANRSLAHVARMGAGPASGESGSRDLICTNFNDRNANLAVLDAKGQRLGEFAVEGRVIYCFLGADLAGNGQLAWCGLSSTKANENVALGFSLRGKEQWHLDLPSEPQPRPVEPIIAGQLASSGPGQWLLPCPDGSIRIVAADGKPLDSFAYGDILQGVATVEIGGKPALLIASPTAVEALAAE